jgi:hypothetical protein
MRSLRILGLITISFLVVQTGSAQEGTPSGSYQQTCSDISAKKGTLSAKCKDDKGKVHSTKLSGYSECSDITNKDGELQCTVAADKASASVPRGSYRDTCRSIQMKGATLHALCRSNDGHEALTTMAHPERCSEGIANLNGILNCQVSDVLPPGSYISSCKDVRMKGTTLYASCNNGKDQWMTAELHEANRCTGDVANENGTLRCVPIKPVEKH